MIKDAEGSHPFLVGSCVSQILSGAGSYWMPLYPHDRSPPWSQLDRHHLLPKGSHLEAGQKPVRGLAGDLSPERDFFPRWWTKELSRFSLQVLNA